DYTNGDRHVDSGPFLPGFMRQSSEQLDENTEKIDAYLSTVPDVLWKAYGWKMSVWQAPSEGVSPVAVDNGNDRQSGVEAINPATKAPGGIDFRFLPIVTQSMNNLKLSIQGQSPAGTVPEYYRRINLTQEWSDIERLVNSGITPSAERLKEYLASSVLRGNLDQDTAKRILSCITDILRMEEESCALTDPTLKDILVVLGSGRSGEELRVAFNK
ncbi:MAG: hypothetical protein Q7S42_01055, partial [Candidatus Omnitrophota bacterium]|nr:hypothetical protein [Candidatus Omnitrophota bacterium]